MKRVSITTLILFFMCVLSAPLFAQDPPPPNDQQGDFGGPQGRGGGFDRPYPGGAGAMMGGPRGGRGGPPPPADMQKVEALRAYLDVVDRMAKLSQDRTASGVAAVVSATDILRQRGPESAITYLNKTLAEVKDPAIQRAIRIQLADLFRQSGQSDKALEQYDVLIKSQ
ncbi:MAG TPA: hypothetical protein VHD56_19040 [Tepidisphaeraceae bacterium]|nr:hypothetical protein [Tepidisphaeraceae bacterium]